jgi:RNA recognition motif-containing protein
MVKSHGRGVVCPHRRLDSVGERSQINYSKRLTMAVRLFVGNLPFDVTESELREYFSSVGPLSYVFFPTDRETGKRRGFAFVEFGEPAHAEQAIARFNNQVFRGRALAVNEARARESRPPGAGPRPMGSRPPGSYPRPAGGRPDFGAPEPGILERSSRGDRRTRNFGPDAKPTRARRYGGRGGRGGDGAKKGPLRERVGGQFFGPPDDELYEKFEEEDRYGVRLRPEDEEKEEKAEEKSEEKKEEQEKEEQEQE